MMQLNAILKTKSDEAAIAIFNGLEHEVVISEYVVHEILFEMDDLERNEFFESVVDTLNNSSEKQLGNFVQNLVRTIDNCFIAIDTQLSSYVKTCGAEDVTAEEAYHQVKSIPLLPVQLDSIKCSTSILQQIYQKVPRSVNNELIKSKFKAHLIKSTLLFNDTTILVLIIFINHH